MQGNMMVIATDGAIAVRECKTPPSLADLQAAVGGPIEPIHSFETLWVKERPWQCVAYCHEEGKLDELPINEAATLLWHEQVPQMRGRDVLVGPIVILWGDKPFLANL